MASSGTASLNIDVQLNPRGKRALCMVTGRAQIKSAAVLEADVLEMKTIQNFIAMPAAAVAQAGAVSQLFGSVTVAGSYGNNVTLATARSSITPHTGTQHVGTIAGGTLQISFLAMGH